MIGRKTLLVVANMVVGSVLGAVALVVTAKWFGPGYSGEVLGTMGFLGILFFMTDLGMGSAHIKRVSEGRDPGDCFATFAAFKVASTFAFVLVVLGGLWYYTLVLHKPLVDTSAAVVLLVLLYYVGKSLAEIGQSSFDARLETARSQLTSFTDTTVRVLTTLAGGLLVLAALHGAGPLAGRVAGRAAEWARSDPAAVLALATAAGGMAAALVSVTMLVRVLERGRFRWDLLRDYATFAFPLFLTTAVAMIAANVDSAALLYFRSEEEAGLFGNVRRIPLMLGGLSSAVGLLLFPTISALAARHDRDGIQSYVDKAIRYLSMLLLPMLAFIVVFAEPIVRIVLSNEFLPAANALRVMCAYVLVTSLATPHATAVMGMGRSDVAAKISGACAVLVVVLNVLLVPDDIRSLGLPLAGLGVMGAAIATLVSGVVYYAAFRLAMRSLAGYRERAHVWRHALAALLMAGALWGLHVTLWPLVHWYDAIGFTAIGGALYLVLLLGMREFTREDWRYVVDSVHPLEMLRYVRGELTHRRR